MEHAEYARRMPAVAGRFYPGDPARLHEEIRRHLGTSEVKPRSVRALIGPHAGLVYSGAILGETYARTVVPSRAIVMCPNHTGAGARASVWSGGSWEFPGARVPIDDALRAQLLAASNLLEPDTAAHEHEHAIEVHLPFLQARRSDAHVVPIVLGGLSFEQCQELGETLSRVVGERVEHGDDVLLVASTDMSHFHDAQTAHELDHLALDRVLAMDPAGLYETVRRRGISMCGFIPTTVVLCAARSLGAKNAELVRYGHSGEVSGDNDRVVGYAGVLVD